MSKVQAQTSKSPEINDQSSYLVEQTDSGDESYEEILQGKVDHVDHGNNIQSQVDLEPGRLNELSTSNFQFQLDQSCFDQIPSKKIQQNFKSDQLPKKQTTKSSKIHQLKENQETDFDDQMDLSELLELLDDEDKFKKSYSKTIESSSKQTSCSLKQVQKPKPKLSRQMNGNIISDRKNVQNHHTSSMNPQKETMNNFPMNQRMNRPQKLSHNNFVNARRQYSEKNFLPNNLMNIQTKNYAEYFASQNFLFWNVLISVKLCSFMSLTKNILLVPFSSSQFNDGVSKTIIKVLKYNMKQILNVETFKRNQKTLQDGSVFSVKAKGLEKNYRGIYFMKSPDFSKQNMKYYSVGALNNGLKSVFHLVDEHMEENIVVPDFEWGTLSQNQICENVISSIFRQINQKKKNYQCQFLREVVISVNNCQNFNLYSKWLRAYVHQLRG